MVGDKMSYLQKGWRYPRAELSFYCADAVVFESWFSVHPIVYYSV
ncbi:hypothetical protein TSMEX_000984, partial [Taenia solium]